MAHLREAERDYARAFGPADPLTLRTRYALVRTLAYSNTAAHITEAGALLDATDAMLGTGLHGDDDLALADVERESTVYLIPEMDTPEALEAFVRERYLEILETELRAWEEDERQWPEAIDWPLFQRFLKVEHSYLAIDLDDEAALEISEIDDSLLLDVDQD